jgi:hypothetical protein
MLMKRKGVIENEDDSLQPTANSEGEVGVWSVSH